MDRKYIDPRKQFSKWLAKSGAIYWIVYNTLLLVLICIRPEVAMACVYLAIIVSVVMIIHVVEYTRNSLGEKLILAGISRLNVGVNIGGKSGKGSGSNEVPVEEEGGNG